MEGKFQPFVLPVAAQVVGPNFCNVWFRPQDQRQLVIVGEYHNLVFPSDTVVCEDGFPFLHWFVQQMGPDFSKWDVFLEIPKGGERPFQLNPLNALDSFLRFNKLGVRVHWSDLRQDPDNKEFSIVLESLHELSKTPTPTSETIEIMKQRIIYLYRQTIIKIDHANLLTEKQIIKMERAHDRFILRYLLAGRIEEFSNLFTSFLNIKYIQDMSELITLYRRLISLNNSLMEYYFLARMLKPYVRNALFVTGDSHRINLQVPLAMLGFIQLFPGQESLAEVGHYSCTNMPDLKFNAMSFPSDDLIMPRYILPVQVGDIYKPSLLISQLKSSMRYPYSAEQMNTSHFEGITEDVLLDIAKSHSLDMDKVKDVVSRWKRAGIVKPAPTRKKRRRGN